MKRSPLPTAVLVAATFLSSGCEPFKTQRSRIQKFEVEEDTAIRVAASGILTVSSGKPNEVYLHTTRVTRAFLTSYRLQKNIRIAVSNQPGLFSARAIHPFRDRRYRLSMYPCTSRCLPEAPWRSTGPIKGR